MNDPTSADEPLLPARAAQRRAVEIPGVTVQPRTAGQTQAAGIDVRMPPWLRRAPSAWMLMGW